ncbi:MAG: hypothetical protein IKO93_03520 [Lentisphaeria bacterium]|nr:hypothetical protein [Lentisphaeria bacterium]
MKKLSVIMLLSMGILILSGCGEVQYRAVPPESREMKYLLFPVKSYRNTLNRAIIVSGEELYTKGKIAYWVGNAEVTTEKSNFTLRADATSAEPVERLNAEIIKWGKETDYRRIEYSKENDQVLLTVVFKNGRKTFFRYKITGDHTVTDAECGTAMISLAGVRISL